MALGESNETLDPQEDSQALVPRTALEERQKQKDACIQQATPQTGKGKGTKAEIDSDLFGSDAATPQLSTPQPSTPQTPVGTTAGSSPETGQKAQTKQSKKPAAAKSVAVKQEKRDHASAEAGKGKGSGVTPAAPAMPQKEEPAPDAKRKPKEEAADTDTVGRDIATP